MIRIAVDIDQIFPRVIQSDTGETKESLVVQKEVHTCFSGKCATGDRLCVYWPDKPAMP